MEWTKDDLYPRATKMRDADNVADEIVSSKRGERIIFAKGEQMFSPITTLNTGLLWINNI